MPAVIRGSADWEGKKSRKKKKKNKNSKDKDKETNRSYHGVGDGSNSLTCMDVQDVWCGPGIGFSPEDCMVARRNASSGRGKIDGEKTHREVVLLFSSLLPSSLCVSFYTVIYGSGCGMF